MSLGKPLSIKRTHADYADRYDDDGPPERMTPKDSEYKFMGKSGPAQRWYEYHMKPEERGYIGGFNAPGYWLGILRNIESGYDQSASASLASWFRIPEDLVPLIIKLPYRVCHDWQDLFIDFGSEEALYAFCDIVEHYEQYERAAKKIQDLISSSTLDKDNGEDNGTR